MTASNNRGEEVSVVWFRQDLRVADHPALAAAAERGAVVPVYIWGPSEEGDWPPGGAARWRLHHSLTSLGDQLKSLGAALVLRRGDALDELRRLVDETGASAVYWNRRYEPFAIARDKKVKSALEDDGLGVRSFNGSLLYEPWEVATQKGDPYQVFTPFWRSCQAKEATHDLIDAPAQLAAPKAPPKSVALDDLQLLPKIGWDEQFYAAWQCGAPAAEKALADFVSNRLGNYDEGRNRIDVSGWSQLSHYLHFGELSPRQVKKAVRAAYNGAESLKKSSDLFMSEIGWREFAHHLLYHFPETTKRPLREKFEDFPWTGDDEALRKWKRGQTGYPIVDAAMRQLWAVGWMPNRARMIVASFLTKHLLVSWLEGAEWFWDTLIDADLANNTLGWQWTSGCGADAAPYFRIFNPVSQAEKFDPHGDYIRRWVPELSDLEKPGVYRPWDADDQVLQDAGVVLGEDYPEPIVDHADARQAALDAYDEIKG